MPHVYHPGIRAVSAFTTENGEITGGCLVHLYARIERVVLLRDSMVALCANGSLWRVTPRAHGRYRKHRQVWDRKMQLAFGR